MYKSKLYNLLPFELQNLLNSSNTYKEILEYVGIRGSSSTRTLKKIISEYNLDTSVFENNKKIHSMEIAKSNHKNTYNIEEKLKKGTKISSHKLKNKLIEFGIKDNKCEECGISEWMGQPVKFHLHHKDGDHYNNELENLQILCPNCHSITKNYGVYNSDRYKQKYYCKDCGKEIRKNKTGLCIDCYRKYRNKNREIRKNKTNKNLCPICKTNYKNVNSKTCISCRDLSPTYNIFNAITREDLKQLIRTTPFTTIGRIYGVSDNTIRKWCIKHNLPSKSNDIKKYNDDEWITI